MTREGICTIAGNDKELVIFSDLVYRDVRECGHNLLLRGEVGTLLELEVANGSAQRKIAVDSAEIDETACRTDSRLLTLVLRLVVE